VKAVQNVSKMIQASTTAESTPTTSSGMTAPSAHFMP
jgi:hypothetical protein